MVKAEAMVNTKDRQPMATTAILVKDRIHLTSWVKISFLAFKVSQFSFFEFAYHKPSYLFHLNNSVNLDFQQFGPAFNQPGNSMNSNAAQFNQTSN
jgi:hypothetical protein